MDYLIATHNEKKRAELARILEPLGIGVLTGEQIGIVLTDVEETGTTFEENALLKSRSGCRESNMPCIADDSGLMVDHLDGAPGVFSARFAGEHGNDKANIELLLDKLKNVPKEQRGAKFVCVVSCTYPDGEEIVVSGECRGYIGFEPVGSGGFGYDPVFMVGEKSFAQLSEAEKDIISHRGAALRKLVKALADR